MCETLENPESDEVEGCFIECQEGDILQVDPRTPGSWKCVHKSDEPLLICPGAFNTGVFCLNLNGLLNF